jgi:hypothetical protein
MPHIYSGINSRKWVLKYYTNLICFIFDRRGIIALIIMTINYQIKVSGL